MIYLPSQAYAYFDSTMDGYLSFQRPTIKILITVTSGPVNMSLDGVNSMSLAVGTHQLDIKVISAIFTGGGVYSGYAVSY